MSSAWEGCSVTAAMGREGSFFDTDTLTSSCFHLCVFEVVVFLSCAQVPKIYNDDIISITYGMFTLFFLDIRIPRITLYHC